MITLILCSCVKISENMYNFVNIAFSYIYLKFPILWPHSRTISGLFRVFERALSFITEEKSILLVVSAINFI